MCACCGCALVVWVRLLRSLQWRLCLARKFRLHRHSYLPG
uniref:Uncharacterized protein n=1 Tax=Herelleviridae sp. cttEB8 TaxID=2825832 RepID=A0A8S5P6X7_9CAUD|nr:MAG TPA: hypothetical protein [Herelleviridae sp. cttEB8]